MCRPDSRKRTIPRWEENKISIPRVRTTISALLIVLIIPGCSREQSPEQKEADRVIARAREAYAASAFHNSRSLFLTALAMNERLGRAPQAAEALESLAGLAASAGQTDSALVLDRLAVERYRSLADRDAVRHVTLHMASLYRRMGDDRKAAEFLTEALRLAVLFKDDAGAAEIRSALADVAAALELDEERMHREALLQSAGEGPARARYYLADGVSALERGDAAAAGELLLKALTYADRSGDSLLTINVLCRLAMSHATAGNISQAFDVYTDALRRTDVTRGASRIRYEMLTRVGTIYLGTGAPAEAGRFYRPALTAAIDAGDKLAEGYLFVQLGHCEPATAGGLETAVRDYRSALDLFSGVGYHRGAAYALSALGTAAMRANRPAEALDYYRRAAAEDTLCLDRRSPHDVFEECERTFRMKNGQAAADPLIELQLQLGRNDEAFRSLEQKHERELAAELAVVEIRTGEPVVDSLLGAWKEARGLLLAAERQLGVMLASGPAWHAMVPELQQHADGYRRRMDDAAEAIAARKPSLAMMVRPGGLTPAEVQSMLPRGTALAAYAAGDRSLYVFLVSGAGTSVKMVPAPRTTLLLQVADFWSGFNRRVALEDSVVEKQRDADRRLQEMAAALYPQFVRPVEGLAAAAQDLYIVLPRELSQLPLHALRRGSSGALRRSAAEQTAIHYLPAAAALQLPSDPPPAAHDIAGIGHPGTTGWDVEYELRDIRAFYKDTPLLFGREATFEGMAKMGGDIMHMAAEFRFGMLSAGNSVLVLSDGKTVDGVRMLPWGMLPQARPRSACVVSDLGPHASGKNALLAQLLLMGGSRDVVLHAFTPLRKSRKVFGEGFYTALLSGADPVHAFRQAQLQMAGDPHGGLHQWAAFALWGK
jgi:tetratricopeptide (TPR) repeat protein